jgi:hypothetical protein
MFQLDDAFLQKIGIADWPPEARQRFVDNFRQVLELRVGTVLSDGLSEVQLNEFESFMNQDATVITAWIDEHEPDYEEDEIYQSQRKAYEKAAEQRGVEVDQLALFADYAQLKWLTHNRPDYTTVVRETFEGLVDLAKADPQKFLTQEGLASIFQSSDAAGSDIPDELEGGHPDPDVALAA